MVARDFHLAIVILFYIPALCLSAAPGTLSSFLDYSCTEPIVINPTFTIPVGACLVTKGVNSLIIQFLPPCSTGVASLVMYRDRSCANAIDMSDVNFDDNCYSYYGYGSINAVQFVCPEVAGGSVATTTTTATFGSTTIPVASGASFSGTGSQPTAPSSNEAAPTTTPTSNSVDGDGGGRSGSGLSQHATIALGVAIPVIAVLVALLAWWFPCKKGKGLREDHHPNTGHMPMPIPPQYANWNPTASPIHEVPATRGYKYQ